MAKDNNKKFLDLEDALYKSLDEAADKLHSIKGADRDMVLLRKQMEELKKTQGGDKKTMNANINRAIKAFDALMSMKELSPERRKLVTKMGWKIQQMINKAGKHVS